MSAAKLVRQRIGPAPNVRGAIGRPPTSPVLLHVACDLVVAGVPVAEAARRKR
jgi:hypothetical protein